LRAFRANDMLELVRQRQAIKRELLINIDPSEADFSVEADSVMGRINTKGLFWTIHFANGDSPLCQTPVDSVFMVLGVNEEITQIPELLNQNDAKDSVLPMHLGNTERSVFAFHHSRLRETSAADLIMRESPGLLSKRPPRRPAGGEPQSLALTPRRADWLGSSRTTHGRIVIRGKFVTRLRKIIEIGTHYRVN
jgi:hypothetical protein